MEFPEKLLHASRSPCKPSSAKAALLQLGPEHEKLILEKESFFYRLPAIITDKVSIDTVVNSLGWVEAVPADNALWSREGAG